MVADYDGYEEVSGVLFVGADGVLRTSKCVPSCECMMMSVWKLSHEECEKAFKCDTLEVLEISNCKLRQIPRELGKMKKLKKIRLDGLDDLRSIPEEMGDLSSLEELWIVWSGVESLPKRLNDLRLRTISLMNLSKLQLNAEDLVVFSKLKHFLIWYCDNVLTPPFAQSFWEMIKSSTCVRVAELSWDQHNREMSGAALEENGSIVDGGWSSESYARFFKRNKENLERAMECVVHLLAIRRWRNALSNVPKEMIQMLAMTLWITRCDVAAWTRRSKE